MTFLRLGIINARRSLARSLFAILSMAIAAGFLTYSISLSRGYPFLFKADPRAVIGGEAVVFARQFGGRIPEGASLWEHAFLEESYFSDLETFHPELLKHGYLSFGQDHTFFSIEDQQRIASTLPAIKAIYPRYQLPAELLQLSGRAAAPLHGRDAALDSLLARSPAELIVDGRWFNTADEGQPVAVVSAIQSKRHDRVPMVGEVIRVAIPRFKYIDGQLVVLEGESLVQELTVVGLIQAVTRYITVGGSLVPVYWELDEIQVPLQTWWQLWREAGGVEYLPEQLSVLCEEQAYIEDMVYELSNRLPEYTVYSTVAHFEQAERRGLIERLTPNLQQSVVSQETQAAMPLDLRVPFTILIFVNATLIVAANLLIMVSERTREVGILKAVGSTRFQVVQMVVAEALLISVTGATVGFIFFRFPATLAQITNGLSAVALGATILSDASVVYGVTLIFAAVFGVLPGLRMAGLSVMEVLRSE